MQIQRPYKELKYNSRYIHTFKISVIIQIFRNFAFSYLNSTVENSGKRSFPVVSEIHCMASQRCNVRPIRRPLTGCSQLLQNISL